MPVLLIAGMAALLVIIAVVLVLVFTVFKDNTGKARELVKRGDKYMEAVQTEAGKGNDALNSLMSNIETIDTSTAFKEQADEVRSAIESAQKELKSAEKEYREVESLSGVEQYKTYAKAVLELIALDFEIQDTTNEFLDYIEGQCEAAAAGRQVSSDEIRQTTSEYVENVNKMAEEANDLRDKADKLRSDNHLY